MGCHTSEEDVACDGSQKYLRLVCVNVCNLVN